MPQRLGAGGRRVFTRLSTVGGDSDDNSERRPGIKLISA